MHHERLRLIRAVSGLCGSLAIQSTAEGVETREQFRILQQENCDSVQGYLISHPIPADQVARMVETFRRRQSAAAAPRAA